MTEPELNPTGYDWLRRVLEVQGKLQADLAFTVFALGQAGVALGMARTDEERERARVMTEVIESERRDLRKHAAELDRVLRDMVANARRNANR